MTIRKAILLCAMPMAAMAQPAVPLDVTAKFDFQARSVASPWSVAESAAYAGILQEQATPREWGDGGSSYGHRFASTMGASAIHGGLGFGLTSVLHQDPRYFRSGEGGVWRRTAHALRGTVLTRTDTGGETLSTWRLGSDYGAAFLSNEWYPDRVNTVRLGALQGTYRLGFDFASNLGSEFWPDIKHKLLHRKP